MDIWLLVLIVDYIIAAIGLIANLVYFKSVVLNTLYDGYWRIASCIISSSMLMIILSHIVSSIICLSYDGSYFPSRHCGKSQLYFLTDYFNNFGEFSVAAGVFIMIFERYGSVFFPSFRLSCKYKTWFTAVLFVYLIGLSVFIYLMRIDQSPIAQLSGMFSISFIYVLSFLVAIDLWFFAKKRYYKTVGQIPLEQRYLLSESFELCRKCFFPIFSLLTINISLFVSFWLFVMNVIPFGYMYQYFLLYDIILNVSATLFPILFLIACKRNRRKVGEIKNGDHVDGVRQLNGNKINTTQSQEEYFLQLQSTWA